MGEVLLGILGLCMMAGQIMGAVKCFGGGKKRPQWLNIIVGITVCFMFLAVIGLATE